MNRREFLKLLMTFGCQISIPLIEIDTAPEDLIDSAWSAVLETPIIFYVGDSRDLTTDKWPVELGYENEGRAQALRFFEYDFGFNELLGIKIVEGCCPGSDFFAAVLSKSLVETNELAKKHGIPIQFAWGESPIPSGLEAEDFEMADDEEVMLPTPYSAAVELARIAFSQIPRPPLTWATRAKLANWGRLETEIEVQLLRYWREHGKFPSGVFMVEGYQEVQLPEIVWP